MNPKCSPGPGYFGTLVHVQVHLPGNEEGIICSSFQEGLYYTFIVFYQDKYDTILQMDILLPVVLLYM